MKKILILHIYIILSTAILSSQNIKIYGNIIDAETKKPVPFANVFVKGTTNGTITDDNGFFTLETNNDSIWSSAIGYIVNKVSVKQKLPLKIFLSPEVYEIDEIKILPNDYKVRYILKQAIKNKKKNNPDQYKKYSYEKYSRWDYRLNNAEESLMKMKVFSKYKNLFKKSLDGSMHLPVYFSEQLVYNEYQKHPYREKSTVLARKTSGIGVMEQLEISGYTNGLDVKINYYTNFIRFFDQNFVSPLANNGHSFYRYYLTDSLTTNNGVKHYKIEFYPKRKGENVFKGFMIIDNKHYAITEIEAVVPTGNHLNFVKSMNVKAEYQFINDSIPFFKTHYTNSTFDYLPSGKSKKERLELTSEKFISYDKIIINPEKPIVLSSNKLKYESVNSKGFENKSDSSWKAIRHEPLTKADINKFEVIDSVNNIPRIKTANKIAEMGLSGYLDIGKIELGPYGEFIKFNEVEGLRLYAGGRTSSEINPHWMLYGGISYGTRNNLLSGSGGIGYKFNTPERKILNISYEDRYVRMGENDQIRLLRENMLSSSEANIVASMFIRDKFDEIYRQKKINMTYQTEWLTGLSSIFTANFIHQYSPEFYPFFKNNKIIPHINAMEIGAGLRLSWKERYIDRGYRRLYVSSDYPIINFRTLLGKVSFGQDDNLYAKIHMTVKAKQLLGTTYLNYAIEAGKIFGKLPYTMLEIPRGNETFGFYRYDFNLVNYLEFVHDQYFHLYTDYHLMGFMFNRIPFLRRFAIREVISAKAMVGSLSDKQKKGILLPQGINEVDGAYLEVGVGLENVFRFFRIEGLYRVLPESKIKGVPKYGIRVRFELKL